MKGKYFANYFEDNSVKDSYRLIIVLFSGKLPNLGGHQFFLFSSLFLFFGSVLFNEFNFKSSIGTYYRDLSFIFGGCYLLDIYL